jgi:hypothetical protein
MSKPSGRRTKGAVVKSRVTDQIKEDIRLLASLRSGGESESESLILREALARYFDSPDVQKQLEQARASARAAKRENDHTRNAPPEAGSGGGTDGASDSGSATG